VDSGGGNDHNIKSSQLMEIFFSINGFVLIRVVCSVFSHKKPEPLGKSS
jgi:hypothetical protein